MLASYFISDKIQECENVELPTNHTYWKSGIFLHLKNNEKNKKPSAFAFTKTVVKTYQKCQQINTFEAESLAH